MAVGGDVLSVHSLVRYTMQRADPAQDDTSALREKLWVSAVQVLVDLLQDVVDIRNQTRLALEVAHAKYLCRNRALPKKPPLVYVAPEIEDLMLDENDNVREGFLEREQYVRLRDELPDYKSSFW